MHFRDVVQKAVGRVGVDPDAWLGTRDLQRAGRFEDEVGQVIGRVLAVRSLSAEADILELGEPFRAGRRHRVQLDLHALRHLQPDALQQLHGRLLRDPALGHVLLVERPQILVPPALAHGARGLLDAVEHLAPPLRLERLPERARRVLRNPFADLGDLLQFLLPLRILLLRGQLGGELRIAPGPDRHGVAGHDDGFEERLLVDDVAGLRERGQLRLGLLADALDAAGQDLLEVRRPVLRVAHGRGRHDDARHHDQVVRGPGRTS